MAARISRLSRFHARLIKLFSLPLFAEAFLGRVYITIFLLICAHGVRTQIFLKRAIVNAFCVNKISDLIYQHRAYMRVKNNFASANWWRAATIYFKKIINYMTWKLFAPYRGRRARAIRIRSCDNKRVPIRTLVAIYARRGLIRYNVIIFRIAAYLSYLVAIYL